MRKILLAAALLFGAAAALAGPPAGPDCDGDAVPDSVETAPVRWTVSPPEPLALEVAPGPTVAGDFNLDGTGDLAAVDQVFQTEPLRLAVHWGAASRRFAPPAVMDLPARSVPVLAAGDVDGDGDRDLVLGHEDPRAVSWIENRRDGSFAAPQELAAATVPIAALAAADLDGDGADDVVFSARDRSTTVRYSGGQSRRVSTPETSNHVQVIDLDADGRLDLALSPSQGKIHLAYANEEDFSVFSTDRTYFGIHHAPQVVDTDGDGDLDLAIHTTAPGAFVYLAAGGVRPLEEDVALPNLSPFLSLASADFDRDGDGDLIGQVLEDICGGDVGALRFVESHAGHGLSPPVNLVEAPVRIKIETGDFDGDGRADLALTGPINTGDPGEALILWNLAADGAATRDCNLNTVPDDCERNGRDCDGNGILDGCDLASGRARDCNANGFPDACEPDCDADGVPNDCAIAAGARDADHDAIPDSCVQETVDCDRNQADDRDELARGLHADCNGNGIPDACDLSPSLSFLHGGEFRSLLDRGAIASAGGDLNGDGLAELVVADLEECCVGPRQPGRLTVFAAAGAGRYRSAGSYKSSESPWRVLLVDFTGDGRLDLLAQCGTYYCRDFQPGGIDIYAGRGDGSLAAPRRVFDDGGNLPVQVGDIDGDLDLDFVTFQLVAPPYTVRVHRQDDAGGIRSDAPAAFEGQSFGAVALGDIDGRSGLELLVSNITASTIDVYALDGLGRTSKLANVRMDGPGQAYGLVSADIDGDQRTDIAASVLPFGPEPAAVQLLRQAGPLEFQRTPPLRVATNAVSFFAVDLNADLGLDLVACGTTFSATSEPRPGRVSAVIHGGAGALELASEVPAAWMPSSAAPADADGDGRVDVAVTGAHHRTLEVSRNLGGGVFGGLLDAGVDGGPRGIVAGDWQGDGRPDLAVATTTGRAIHIFHAHAGGSMAERQRIASTAEAFSLTVIDLERDGDLDLAAAETFHVEIFDNDGAGRFQKRVPIRVGSGPVDIAAADLDLDGDDDIATANSLAGNEIKDNVSVFENDGSGVLLPARNYLAGNAQTSIAVADVSGDGKPEIIVGTTLQEEFLVLERTGAPAYTVAPHAPVDSPQGTTDAAPIDFDADGDADLVLVRWADIVWMENRAGLLQTLQAAFVDPTHALAPGDFDGDGFLDLLVTAPERELVFLQRDNDGSWFESSGGPWDEAGAGGSGSTPNHHGPWAIATADFDLDGRLDAAFPFDTDSIVHVLLNRTPAAWADVDANGTPDACQSDGAAFRRGDANADGNVDLSDAVTVLRHLFLTGEPLRCASAADADDDGALNITDAVRVLTYLFLDGGPPPEPWSACGLDRTGDGLDCEEFPAC